MSDEPKYIISGRVGHSSVVPGSDITECSQCHHPVWISLSSQKIMKELGHPVAMLCLDCATPKLKEAAPEDICPINNGQLVEVARYLGISLEEAAEKITKMMSDVPGLHAILDEYQRESLRPQ